MKYSLAVCALVGMISQNQINALKMKMDLNTMTNEADSVLMQFEEQENSKLVDNSFVQQNMRTVSDSESSESSDSEEDHHQRVGVHADNVLGVRMLNEGANRRVEETGKNFGGFEAGLDGFVGNNHNSGEWKDAYDRVVPGNFEDGDGHQVDAFTRKVIKDYSTEGVTKEGKPDGHFFITKDQAKDLTFEVVETHLGYEAKKAKEFVEKNFQPAWEHYDVNEEGTIDALWVSTLMRFMCKPVKDIDLQ